KAPSASHPRAWPGRPRRPQSSGRARPPGPARGVDAPSCEVLVDELDDPLDRAATGVGHRLLADVALSLTLEQLELDFASRLSILADEAVEVGARVCEVLGALQIDRRRHLDLLTALERDHRAAFRHRLFGLPVLIVTRQHAIDDLGVRLAARLQPLRIAVASERIDDGPAEDRRVDAGVHGR